MQNRPVKVNGYSNYGRIDAKTRRREEGEARNEAWRKLTPMQQIGVLNSRSGRSERQRRKILSQVIAQGGKDFPVV